MDVNRTLQLIKQTKIKYMGLFGKLLKTGLHVVTTPVAIVKDVVTFGGLNTGEDKTYTTKQLHKIKNDIEEVDQEIDDL